MEVIIKVYTAWKKTFVGVKRDCMLIIGIVKSEEIVISNQNDVNCPDPWF
jgi:hypothetical protein